MDKYEFYNDGGATLKVRGSLLNHLKWLQIDMNVLTKFNVNQSNSC